MYRVKVVCDNNFTKGSDIDKSIESLLKMFKKRFSRKRKPLASDSSMERIYEYENMTHDELRIMKKILETNKTRVHLKTIVSVLADEKAKDAKQAKKAQRLSPGSSVESSVKLSRRLPSSSSLASAQSAASRARTTPSGSEASFGSLPEADSKSAVLQEMRELCTSMQTLIERLEQL